MNFLGGVGNDGVKLSSMPTLGMGTVQPQPYPDYPQIAWKTAALVRQHARTGLRDGGILDMMLRLVLANREKLSRRSYGCG